MRPALRVALVVAGLSLAAGAVWTWYAVMEKRFEAELYLAPEALDNPMLAATELLQHHAHSVRIEDTLGAIVHRPLPDGTMVLADTSGAISDKEFGQLMAWVRRGNTLIATPAWAPDAGRANARLPLMTGKAGSAGQRIDPLVALTGVALSYRSNGRRDCDVGDSAAATAAATAQAPAPAKNAENKREHYLACLTLPGARFPLALETSMNVMEEQKRYGPRPPPLWSDREAVAVRVYAEGAGHLVLTATDFFNNDTLRQQDHAELLLALAALQPAAPTVVVVLHLDTLRWYQMLWLGWRLPLSGLALFLLLLLWRALRRFGPLLAEPGQARRALLQHVEASGNWLWQAPGGRDLLLAAARRASAAQLQRRLPEWPALSAQQQLRLLAAQTSFSAVELDSALHAAAASRAPAFTRQIQILQQLRKQYE